MRLTPNKYSSDVTYRLMVDIFMPYFFKLISDVKKGRRVAPGLDI
jgi:hypothetical protein